MDEIVKTSPVTPDTKQKVKIPIEEMKHEDLVAQVKRQIIFLQKAKAKCDDLNHQISTLQLCKEENSALRSHCSELEDKLELNEKEFEEEKRKQKEVLSAKDSELSRLKDELLKVCKEKLEYDEQMQCLKMKNSTMGEMCQCLQQEVTDLTKNKEEERKQLLLVTEARDSALTSLKQLKGFLKEKDERVQELQAEVNSAKDQNTNLLSKFDSLISEIGSLSNQNSSLEVDYGNVKRQLKAALDECENWKAKVEELENEKDDYVGPPVDVSELQYKLEELEQELDTISQEKNQLSEENQSLSNRIEELESSPVDEKNSSTENDILSQISNYLEQIQSLEEDLLKTTNQKDDLMDELEQVRDLQRFLELETKELREECHLFKDQVEKLETKTKQDSERITSLITELQEAEVVSKEVKRDMGLLEMQLEESHEVMRKLSEDSDIKQSELEKEVNCEANKCKELEIQINSLTESLNLVQNEYAEQNDYITLLKDQIEALTLSNQNKTDEMKIEEYEKEISSLKEQLALEMEKMENLLRENVQNDVALINENETEPSNSSPVDECENQNATKQYQEFSMDELQSEPASNQVESSPSCEDLLSPKVVELTEALNEKSKLVESIHLHMDDLLNKIDELNTTLSEKEGDIESLACKLQQTKREGDERDEKMKLLEEEIEDLKKTSPETVTVEENNLETQLEEIKDDRENLFTLYNNLLDRLRLVEESRDILMQKLEFDESLREFCAELEAQLESSSLDKEDLELKLENLEKNNAAVDKDDCTNCDVLQKQLTMLNNNITEKNEDFMKLEKELELSLQSLEETSQQKDILLKKNAECEKLSHELQELNSKCSFLETQVKECQESVLEKNRISEELLRENQTLKEQLETLTEEINKNKDLIENLQLDSEKSIALTEQNSHLELQCQTLTEKINQYEENLSKMEDCNNSLKTELESLKESVPGYEEKINQLSQEIATLRNENSQLRDKVSAVNLKEDENQTNACQRDVVQKEWEDSKDKIEKLKKVVFKLKRELAEVHKQKDELSGLSRCQIQNFQSLQSEYDKLQDEIELSKSNFKKLEQDIVSKVNEAISLKEQLEQVQSENSKLRGILETEKRDKTHLEQSKMELDSKLIVLKNDKEIERKKYETSQEQVKKLELNITNLEGKLKGEKEAHNQTIQKLEESLKSAKQQQLLNLEINDYETTISNMEGKIKEKDEFITELQKEIDQRKEKELFLKDEIERLNSQRLTEEYRFENLKDTLEKTKSELAKVSTELSKVTSELDQAQSQLENTKTSYEDWQIQLSESSQRVSFLEKSLKSSKENFTKSTKTFEARITSLEEELITSKNELENTCKEFESYKVRVHSVLKQKQTPVSALPSEIEETESLKRSLEAHRNKLELLNEELNIKNMESETLQKEQILLVSKLDKLAQEVTHKDKTWSQKYDQLVKDKESSHSIWESEKSHIIQQKELQNSTFKIQIETLKEEHQMQLDAFQRQFDMVERELFAFKQKELQQQSQKTMQSSLHDDSNTFDISNLERQDGEGSECNEALDLNSSLYKPMSLLTIPSTGFTPLEQLLQPSSEPNTPTTPQDTATLMSNLAVSQRKIDHLVELLNESEASNERMSEQVRLLKDEIRRLERNKEREEIVSNLEYLKNVMIKFITLQEGSERERLVPVLTTMLKLSSEEQQHIQQVASGQIVNAGNNAGWGSYLQWSGLL